MNTDYHKQTATEPCFPEIIWSQPEQAARRGKLAIIGGNAHGVSTVMNAYAQSQEAGIGSVQVVLPDSLRSVTGKILEQGTYAPRNPSGGFSKQALATMLDTAQWADGVLFSGDIGKNSETVILLERFAQEYNRLIAYANDAAEDILKHPEVIKAQGKSALVLTIPQLQSYIKQLKLTRQVTHDIGLSQLIPLVKEVSQTSGTILVILTEQGIVAAYEGAVSFTETKEINSTKLAAYVSVWLIQQPEKPIEALTAGIWQAIQKTNT